MGKNVAVFVDVANIFYAAKAAGVDIDYVTLLKSATAGRDFVRAYAYTGLDPDNENQKNFHAFLARHGFKVVSKDIRKYGDGKVKANLDIELVVDLMKTARNLDVAVVVSGDGDFAPAIRAVQEMGVRVEVISFRGNTSSDLIEVADLFTDIGQIARVDKSSTRSGRRVAGDEEDLSMTEVPEKQSEGRGEARRGRGDRDRGRGRGRDRDRDREREEAPVAAVAGRAGLVALPGERLSKAPGESEDDVDDEDVESEVVAGAEGQDIGGEEGRRRRRRRGGRGRGRGRGREEGMPPAEAREDVELTPFDEQELPVPSRPRTSTFGSVWDTQLGTPAARPAADLEPLDDEDLEEPAIPEYLLAERRGGRGQRQGPGQGGRGGRGRGGTYAAAIDRERYGGGRGGVTRYGEPRGAAPGLSRPDRRPARPDRPERGDRDRDRERPRSGEPWQEVPPELEELIRAQVARSGESRREDRPARPAGQGQPASVPADAPPGGAESVTAEIASTEAASPATSSARRGRGRARAIADADAIGAEQPVAADDTSPAPRRRATRRTAAAPSGSTAHASADAASGQAADVASEAAGSTRRRTTRRTTAPGGAIDGSPGEGGPAAGDGTGSAGDGTATSAASPPARRRVTRRAPSSAGAADASATDTGGTDATAADAASPRRRTRRAPASGEGAAG